MENNSPDIRNLKKLSDELGIKLWQAEAAAGLIDAGSTIPFIARYRKEATGAMDDEALRRFDERLRYLRNLDERRETILNTIEEQGKLTEELRTKIESAETAALLAPVSSAPFPAMTRLLPLMFWRPTVAPRPTVASSSAAP